MDLPNLLNKLKSTSPPPQLFVAVEIASHSVKSAIWQAKEGATEILSIGSIQSWENADNDDLLSAVDLSLTDAYAGLEARPDRVIFGLPQDWVEGSSISSTKKPVIKSICEKLALKPVGFVVSLEAIIHHLKESEGGPPSAIIIHLSPAEIVVSQVYLGEHLGSHTVGRSSSLASDVEEGLARFPHQNTLPSRMILYNSKDDLEAAKQELISHDWLAKLPFLHIPKIESLAKDVSIQAIALSGGAEMVLSLPPSPETTPPPPPEKKPSPPPENLPLDPSSLPFGFRLKKTATSPTLQTPIQIRSYQENTEITLPQSEESTHPHSLPRPSYHLNSPLKPLRRGFLYLSKLASRLFIHRPLWPKTSPFKPWIILPTILIIIFLGAFLAYWYLPKAEVTLYLAEKPIDKQVSFTLNPQLTEINLESSQIPGKTETVTVTGTASLTTTGTKTIGEKAKGKAIIYNRSTLPKNFPSGTQVKTGDLLFYTLETITIASASAKNNADFSVTIEPAKTEVGIIAANIGEKYNLPQNTELSIQNYAKDSFIGTTATAITGGTSQEIQVVSEVDQDNLKKQLIQTLETNIIDQVKQKSNADVGVIPTQKYTITDESYSHFIGDETTTLSSTQTLTETVYLYQLKDITLITQYLAKGDIPEGYLVNSDSTKVSVTQTSLNGDETAQIEAKISLMITPKLDTQVIIEKIKGKYPNVAEDYFRTLPSYSSSIIDIKPRLMPRLYHLPRQPKNIRVSIKPAQN